MYKVAAIGGDGIGPEIVAEGKKVLEAAGERYNFDIEWTDFDIGAGPVPEDKGAPDLKTTLPSSKNTRPYISAPSGTPG